jgi:UDP:flavonoid glycosyltransferase YjiC (YdhE family)
VARILITTFGSYGDLNPYIAIGIELRKRGHEVTIATSRAYGPKVASEGLGFHAVRPDASLDDRAMMEYVFDARRGSERVVRYLASLARESYEDLLPAAARSDCIVTHAVTLAAVAVARKSGLPWISSVLAPMSFLSVYDPPVPAPLPWIVKLRALGTGPISLVWKMARKKSLRWVTPVLDLYRDLGLPRPEHPLFEGLHSPGLALALFSRYMAEPQPDWPRSTVITGFPFYDRHHERQKLAPQLQRFLDEGPAPVVFTLGSSAVGAARNFYRDSLAAAGRLGLRAVFLTGPHPQGLPEKLPPGMLQVDYAPHSEVFPSAAAIVHQGGIGTTAQAMRAGRPMLVVPFAHDQFDNGERMRRLGIGEVLPHRRYGARRAHKRLARLVADARYAAAGASLSPKVAAEEGAAAAAAAIERYLRG